MPVNYLVAIKIVAPILSKVIREHHSERKLYFRL